MSERYNVEVEDVLGENYKITNIECSDYNPSIDGNITLTITVTDVYGDAVSGESVTVVASEGTFTQLNGSDITSASSVTGTTNSSGQFTLTYNCTQWGVIDFTANNASKQINIMNGKRTHNMTPTNITNGGTISFERQGNYVTLAWVQANVNVTNTTVGGTKVLGTLPEGYRPNREKWFGPQYYLVNSNTRQTALAVKPNGSVELCCWWSNSTQQEIACVFTGVYFIG